MANGKNIIDVNFGKEATPAESSGVEKVYQLKITLNDLRPPLWRRLLIPGGITFMELHLIIQAAFGWENAHLFSFRFRTRDVTPVVDDGFDFLEEDALDPEETVIDALLESEKKCAYEYDFGDGWVHKVVLEKILEAEPGKAYPVCLTGRRRCPPEDVGGVWGYENFLRTISNPDDPECGAMLEWATGDAGGTFDPEAFDCAEVNERLGDFARHGAGAAKPSEPGAIEPDIKQWQPLFELARRIQGMAPWENLWDSDLFAIELPGREEPSFVQVLGRNGECYAIVVYPGYEALAKMLRINESAGPAFLTVMGQQECLMCNYGDREEVEPDDREIYKRLGLKFRGRNQWIYFRSLLPGYAGWRLNRQEAALLETVLPQFAAALEAFRGGEFSVRFEEGEVFWRAYSPKTKKWRNEVRKLELSEPRQEVIIVDDDPAIEELRKIRQIKKHMTLAELYFPFPVGERGERPYYPHMILLLEQEMGLICKQQLLSPEDDFATSLLNLLETFIKDFGRPTCLHANSGLLNLVADYCKKIGIKLKEDEDDMTAELLSSLMGGFAPDGE